MPERQKRKVALSLNKQISIRGKQFNTEPCVGSMEAAATLAAAAVRHPLAYNVAAVAATPQSPVWNNDNNKATTATQPPPPLPPSISHVHSHSFDSHFVLSAAAASGGGVAAATTPTHGYSCSFDSRFKKVVNDIDWDELSIAKNEYTLKEEPTFTNANISPITDRKEFPVITHTTHKFEQDFLLRQREATNKREQKTRNRLERWNMGKNSKHNEEEQKLLQSPPHVRQIMGKQQEQSPYRQQQQQEKSPYRQQQQAMNNKNNNNKMTTTATTTSSPTSIEILQDQDQLAALLIAQRVDSSKKLATDNNNNHNNNNKVNDSLLLPSLTRTEPLHNKTQEGTSMNSTGSFRGNLDQNNNSDEIAALLIAQQQEDTSQLGTTASKKETEEEEIEQETRQIGNKNVTPKPEMAQDQDHLAAILLARQDMVENRNENMFYSPPTSSRPASNNRYGVHNNNNNNNNTNNRSDPANLYFSASSQDIDDDEDMDDELRQVLLLSQNEHAKQREQNLSLQELEEKELQEALERSQDGFGSEVSFHADSNHNLLNNSDTEEDDLQLALRLSLRESTADNNNREGYNSLLGGFAVEDDEDNDNGKEVGETGGEVLPAKEKTANEVEETAEVPAKEENAMEFEEIWEKAEDADGLEEKELDAPKPLEKEEENQREVMEIGDQDSSSSPSSSQQQDATSMMSCDKNVSSSAEPKEDEEEWLEEEPQDTQSVQKEKAVEEKEVAEVVAVEAQSNGNETELGMPSNDKLQPEITEEDGQEKEGTGNDHNNTNHQSFFSDDSSHPIFCDDSVTQQQQQQVQYQQQQLQHNSFWSDDSSVPIFCDDSLSQHQQQEGPQQRKKWFGSDRTEFDLSLHSLVKNQQPVQEENEEEEEEPEKEEKEVEVKEEQVEEKEDKDEEEENLNDECRNGENSMSTIKVANSAFSSHLLQDSASVLQFNDTGSAVLEQELKEQNQEFHVGRVPELDGGKESEESVHELSMGDNCNAKSASITFDGSSLPPEQQDIPYVETEEQKNEIEGDGTEWKLSVHADGMQQLDQEEFGNDNELGNYNEFGNYDEFGKDNEFLQVQREEVDDYYYNEEQQWPIKHIGNFDRKDQSCGISVVSSLTGGTSLLLTEDDDDDDDDNNEQTVDKKYLKLASEEELAEKSKTSTSSETTRGMELELCPLPEEMHQARNDQRKEKGRSQMIDMSQYTAALLRQDEESIEPPIFLRHPSKQQSTRNMEDDVVQRRKSDPPRKKNEQQEGSKLIGGLGYRNTNKFCVDSSNHSDPKEQLLEVQEKVDRRNSPFDSPLRKQKEVKMTDFLAGIEDVEPPLKSNKASPSSPLKTYKTSPSSNKIPKAPTMVLKRVKNLCYWSRDDTENFKSFLRSSTKSKGTASDNAPVRELTHYASDHQERPDDQQGRQNMERTTTHGHRILSRRSPKVPHDDPGDVPSHYHAVAKETKFLI